MSLQITESFVVAYGNNFKHLAQQMQPRFADMCMQEPNIVGQSKSVERLSARTAQRRLSRHSATPLNDQGHSRRWIDLEDWEDGDAVDDQDKIRMLIDPSSDYVKALVMGLNRAKDTVALNAMLGTARTGTGTQALPASQIIADGGTNLTKQKIINARKLFRVNEADEVADPMAKLCFVYSAEALEHILNDDTITSSDRTTIEMLQNGGFNGPNGRQYGTWMGFTWIPYEALPKIGNIRHCVAFNSQMVRFGSGKDITTRVAEDPSISFSVRFYACMSIGAVRVEDVGVVRVDIDETA